jgi:TRAP-type C4-dicarboxylate transport system permease large subunit
VRESYASCVRSNTEHAAWRKIYQALLNAVRVGGSLAIIVGRAFCFGRLLTQYQMPVTCATGRWRPAD